MKSPSFRHFVEQEMGKLPCFLIYAVLELTLMAILFLDGSLSYLANVFAELFELVPPCLLCTRVNPLFDRTDHDLHYNTSMCESHKKEISSLAYCHVHKKLSDLRTMCEGCLLEGCCNMPNWLKDDPEKQSANVCSCCGEPIKAKSLSSSSSSYQKASGFANNIVPTWPAQTPCSSPRSPWKNEEANVFDLPQIKHVELKPPKANSIPLGDEDDGNVSNQAKEDVRAAPITIPPMLPDLEDMRDDFVRTPSFSRGGSRLSNMSSADLTTSSPRFASRTPRKYIDELTPDLFENVGVNEPEDSIVNRLKRQMKRDRKSLMDITRELEEERSASAVAANNAMAMITRLQADKASVQMEALQYQRMMEEQSEYDQEALSALHDLLEKREYEMLDMQDELELYRERYGVLRDVVRRSDNFDKSQSFSSFTERSDHEEDIDTDVDGDGGHISPDESVFDIETDVDPDTSINYYDQAFALYENEQLQAGEEKAVDDEDEENEERERSITLNQLGTLEPMNQTSFWNNGDQNTLRESDRVPVIGEEDEEKEGIASNEETNKENDGEGRNQLKMVEEIPKLGVEVTGDITETEEQSEADISKLESTDTSEK